MAQRFGRVNRFGERYDSAITVVHPVIFGKEDKKQKTLVQSDMDRARERTLALLQQLPENASSAALDQLPVAERTAAFSPPPQTRIATAIQFDAWALTSIRKPIAARPPVAPYLHGEDEWQPPETHLAWREELDVIHGDLLAAYPPEDLLEDFPLKPHELLRDTSKRIAETLSKRIEKFFLEKQNDEESQELRSAWLMHDDGSVQPIDLIENSRLLSIYKKNDNERNKEEKGDIKRHKEQLKELLENATLILPASFGGISEQGLFVADARKHNKTDVADIPNIRLRNLPILHAPSPDIPAECKSDYRLVRAIDTNLADESDIESPTRYWLWLEAKKTINGERRSVVQNETLAAHSAAVVANIAAFSKKLFPAIPADGGPNLAACLIAAGQGHDLGKNRRQWQQGIGNIAYDSNKPETILAKSGPAMRGRNLAKNYRHEFGSLHTLTTCNAGAQAAGLLTPFSEIERDIILHLVAAHHGRARPHFPFEEILDYGAAPENSANLAAEIPRRFARLQQCFGRWGLAWLESILRAADYAASAGIVAGQVTDTVCPQPTAPLGKASSQQTGRKQIRLRVDVTNPGQYFACCGLFELAARLAPDTLGWFEQDEDKQWWFVLSETIYSLSTLLEKIVEAEITPANGIAADEQEDNPGEEDEETEEDTGEEEQPEDEDKNSPPLFLGNPFDIRLDWWKTSKGDSTSLKVWAGSMNVLRIASSMKNSIYLSVCTESNIENVLNKVLIVYKQDKKKVESAELKMKLKFHGAKEKEQESIDKARMVMDLAIEQALLKTNESARMAAQNKAEEKFELAQQKAKESRKKKEEKANEILEQARATAKKKVEPFYFDAKRGPNADARDVGFSPNSLKFETDAAPAVEILCLIGLQRAIPNSAKQPRQFIYHLWTKPLSIEILVAAITGQLPDSLTHSYRFESWFRTSERKHKAFLAAKRVFRD
jgi:CRISPR-associated endonuclease/helicase Cas3